MFCKIFFSNKFGFILQIVFSYTGAQQNLWIMLPTLVERDNNRTKTAAKFRVQKLPPNIAKAR